MTPVKITIKGAYGATNFGDDLLMCLFEKFFLNNFNDIDVNFQGLNSDYPSKILIDSRYNATNFDEDWFIYGGGTQFFSYQSKEDRTLFSLIKKVFTEPDRAFKKLSSIITSRNRKKKMPNHTAFLGFGLGPFHGNIEKIANVKKILASADFVGLRDEVSVNYCKEWDIKAFLGADMAYSSYFDYQVDPIVKQNIRKKIGIVVRDWVWEESGRAYFEPIMELYKSQNQNYDFQFIIYAPDKDPDWMRKLRGEDALVWDPKRYSIQQFLNILNSFDGFISARFHGAIIGALLGKPVISVEIEPKLRILTEDIKELSLWQKPFNRGDLDDLLNNLDFNVNYRESLNSLKVRAHFALDEFKDLFNKNLSKVV